jgi:hypothetical protein
MSRKPGVWVRQPPFREGLALVQIVDARVTIGSIAENLAFHGLLLKRERRAEALPSI